MARRVFISYQHSDQMKAKGFNLMSYAENVDVEFVGRHLLDPVDSTSQDYVREKIREQLTGTSVTVVLIGDHTADSDWVDWEIEQSLNKGNGVLGIRLDKDAQIPETLDGCGAEILNWYEPEDVREFADAIDRAALASRRAPLLTSAGGSCSR
jgi:MTH538 TIR-like domain (DUF1863)